MRPSSEPSGSPDATDPPEPSPTSGVAVLAPPATRCALSLTALTAPVAPACNANPTATTKMPGMKSACDPSIRMPTRPSM
jgi:hypothetical protein